jgi:thioredoxin reductase (NADPH)
MRELDLIILGAGVAGLTAATFAGRYGLGVVVVEQLGAGGQIANAERIENFPGFPQESPAMSSALCCKSKPRPPAPHS